MYRRLSDFAVENPATLRRDLQRMDMEILRAFHELTRTPWTVRRVNVDTAARFDEILVVDTSAGDVDVTLPPAEARDAGRALGLIMTSTSNTLTVRTVGADLLNRAGSLAFSAVVGVRARIVFDGVEYWA